MFSFQAYVLIFIVIYYFISPKHILYFARKIPPLIGKTCITIHSLRNKNKQDKR